MVLDRLTESILTGQLGDEGALPSEGDLALSMGVSRTVIREAMRILRSQGLVEMSQGKQPRVKPVDTQPAIYAIQTLLRRTDSTMHHLVEVRKPLEGEIAALAARRATSQDIQDMERAILDLDQAPTLDERVEAGLRFHEALARATGNPVFPLLLRALSVLLRESRRRTIPTKGAPASGNAYHRAILEAVRVGDGQAARAAMLEHLTSTEDHLREAEKTES